MASLEIALSEHILEAASIGAFASVGWLSQALSEGEIEIKSRQFVGGLLTSIFTGVCAYIFLISVGTAGILAAVVSAMLGATGKSGFKVMIKQINKMLGD